VKCWKSGVFPCTVPGCEGSVYTRGLCSAHYRRVRRHGTLIHLRHAQRYVLTNAGRRSVGLPAREFQELPL
jgi:hypothetical protein